MALALLELLTGAAALWLGGAWAGRPVHRFLVRLGWRAPGARGPFLGVSVEALALCVLASSRGQTALAAGTAFGGVHVTIALAFGVGLLLSRGPLESPPAAATILPAVPSWPRASPPETCWSRRSRGWPWSWRSRCSASWP